MQGAIRSKKEDWLIAMKKKSDSIAFGMRLLALLPPVCLGIAVLLLAAYMLYDSAKLETKDGLKNLAYAVHKICEQQAPGDFALENGKMVKGGKPLDPDFALVDQIYSVSGIDATIFWGDQRISTSVEEPDGSRAVGTRAMPEVADTVLRDGKDYFSANVTVRDTPYFGYYIPLRNPDRSIIGMVFVGKTRKLVVGNVIGAMLLIAAATILTFLLVGVVTVPYSKNIVKSLIGTKNFLESVAQGNQDGIINKKVLDRRDEIGEIGRLSLALQKSVTEMIGTDALTHLHNRRSGRQLLISAIEELNQHQTPFTLAMGDIDNFKKVNDQYGHLIGDVVLSTISSIFSDHMKGKGFAIRWGGEEFVLVYENMDQNAAVAHMEKLTQRIREEKIQSENGVFSITMTFGVSQGRKDLEMKDLLAEADEKLYLGKRQGKDQIVR
ncbi:diguanylate cyclase [Clostridiales bacterium]|nr:diguanylate cyclase [Clostridiales bacterium]